MALHLLFFLPALRVTPPLMTPPQELPDAHTKTRLAIAQVLAEQSLLASCAAAWDDLCAALSPPPPPAGLRALAGYGSDEDSA